MQNSINNNLTEHTQDIIQDYLNEISSEEQEAFMNNYEKLSDENSINISDTETLAHFTLTVLFTSHK